MRFSLKKAFLELAYGYIITGSGYYVNLRSRMALLVSIAGLQRIVYNNVRPDATSVGHFRKRRPR